MVDINNDGWLDIYVCRSGAEDPNLRRNLLYVNQPHLVPLLNKERGKRQGGVRFIEQAAQYGLDDDSYSTQATFFDYDKESGLGSVGVVVEAVLGGLLKKPHPRPLSFQRRGVPVRAG